MPNQVRAWSVPPGYRLRSWGQRVLPVVLATLCAAQGSPVGEKLVASDGGSGDQFGSRVALDGDTMVVGAPFEHASYVFERTSTGWVETAKLLAGGRSVSIDGGSIAIGGYGSATVFVRAGGTWIYEAALSQTQPMPDDDFGKSICIRGDRVIVGCPQKLSDSVGAAYVYQRTAGIWGSPAKLVAQPTPQGAFPGGFGMNVAIDGDLVLVANTLTSESGGISQGAVYPFRLDGGQWIQEPKLLTPTQAQGSGFGAAMSLRDTRACITAPDYHVPGGQFSGAAFLFARTNGAWVQQAMLTVPDPQATGIGAVGSACALDGSTILLGASDDESSGLMDSGGAYLFELSGGSWSAKLHLAPPDLGPMDNFGFAVGLSGETALIGSPQSDHLAAVDAGAVYTFKVPQAAAFSRAPCASQAPAGSLTSVGPAPTFGAVLQLEVGDPQGSAGLPPIVTLCTLAMSLAPAPGYPCGVVIPGWGSPAGIGSELLIDPQGANLILLLPIKFWLGPSSPCNYSIAIPADSVLSGLNLFAQGALLAPSIAGLQILLSDGLDLVIGY